MKKPIRMMIAGVAAIGLAIVPAAAANAASSQTSTITSTWDYQYGTAVSPDNNIQALTDYQNDKVYFVYKDTSTVVEIADPSTTVDGPMGIVFSLDGTKVFVANYNANISVIDVASEAVVDEITTGNSENLYLGVSPDGSKLVVTDDYNDVSVFDLTDPSFAQIGSYQDLTVYGTGIYFLDNSTAYIIGDDGNVDVVDITTPTVTASYGSNSFSSYGTCAMPNMASIVIPTTTSVEWIDPATGDSIASLDMTPHLAAGLAFCSVTSEGYVLITDWSRTGDGVLYIIDGNTHTYIETLTLTDVAYTNGVNVMGSDCTVFVDGYYGNVAVVQLDATYCASSPELPNTGVDTTAMTLAATIGLVVVALGAVALIVARRRTTI